MKNFWERDVSLCTISQLEKIVCEIGLVKDNRFSYGDLYQKYVRNDSGGMYQIPLQFAEFVHFLSFKKIDSIFNIGSHNGWTITFLTHYLQCVKKDKINVISIDIKHNSYKELPDVGINFETGTSDGFVGQNYDLCLIDGCHLYNWVKKDYDNVGRHSKICMFHDINDQFCNGVVKFYDEVSVGRIHKEFLYHPNGDNVMGIGVIEKLCFM